MYRADWWRTGMAAVVVLSFCTVGQAAYNKKKTEDLAPMVPPVVEALTAKEKAEQEADMMAKMQEASTPGKGHERLEPLIGKWTYSMKWWKDPNAEPEISTGTSEAQWILGGRFVKEKVNGTAMGQPFEGIGFVGYDNVKDEYVSIWMDNMSTGIMKAKGSYDEATHTLSEEGKFSCPIADGPLAYRSETKFMEDGGRMTTMYMAGPDGKEMKAMELTYTKERAAE